YSPLRLDDAGSIAGLLNTKWKLGLNGSVLIANPIPAEMEIVSDEMEVHIKKALTAAKEQRIIGKNITPFKLQYIAGHTRGESLETNIALIRHNAKIGAMIANAYSKIVRAQFP